MHTKTSTTPPKSGTVATTATTIQAAVNTHHPEVNRQGFSKDRKTATSLDKKKNLDLQREYQVSERREASSYPEKPKSKQTAPQGKRSRLEAGWLQ